MRLSTALDCADPQAIGLPPGGQFAFGPMGKTLDRLHQLSIIAAHAPKESPDEVRENKAVPEISGKPEERMAEAAAVTHTQATGFIRGLGLLDSTMIVAGSMIGSGIFIVSGGISKQVGSPGS